MANILSGEFIEQALQALDAVTEGFPEVGGLQDWARQLRELQGRSPEAGGAFIMGWHAVMTRDNLYAAVKAWDVEALLNADLRELDEVTLGGSAADVLEAVLWHPDADEDLQEAIYEYMLELCTMARAASAVPASMEEALLDLQSAVNPEAPVTKDVITALFHSLVGRSPDLLLSWASQIHQTLRGDKDLIREFLNLKFVKKVGAKMREHCTDGPDGALNVQSVMVSALSTVMSAVGGGALSSPDGLMTAFGSLMGGPSGAEGALSMLAAFTGQMSAGAEGGASGGEGGGPGAEGPAALSHFVSMLTANPDAAREMVDTHIGSEHPLSEVLHNSISMFSGFSGGGAPGGAPGGASDTTAAAVSATHVTFEPTAGSLE